MNNWIVLGAVAGLTGVAGGAFGAHALKTRLTPDLLHTFEIGIRYQMYHAIALLAVGLLDGRLAAGPLRIAGVGFVAGILVFSGSLYILALSGIKWLGAITPIGGLAFLIGWAALIVAGLGRQ